MVIWASEVSAGHPVPARNTFSPARSDSAKLTANAAGDTVRRPCLLQTSHALPRRHASAHDSRAESASERSTVNHRGQTVLPEPSCEEMQAVGSAVKGSCPSVGWHGHPEPQSIVNRGKTTENMACSPRHDGPLRHRAASPSVAAMHFSPSAHERSDVTSQSAELVLARVRASQAVRRWRRWLLHRSHCHYLQSLSKDFHLHVRVRLVACDVHVLSPSCRLRMCQVQLLLFHASIGMYCLVQWFLRRARATLNRWRQRTHRSWSFSHTMLVRLPLILRFSGNGDDVAGLT